MKYQVGDKILILHSNEEAVIIDIINKEMLMVDAGGVQFPVYMDQVDFPYFKQFTEKKVVATPKERKFVDDLKKEKKVAEVRVADGMWLNFLPVLDTDEFGDEVVEAFKIYLINRTEQRYDFTYTLHFFGKADFDLKNQLNPFENFYIHDIPFSNWNDSPSFEFEFILDPPDKKKASHFETSLKLRGKQMFAKIDEMRKKNEASFSYKLFETYPDKQHDDYLEMDKLTAKGYKVYNAANARQHLDPPRSVVDLHIEKLSDDWKHLRNHEIMALQLRTFEKYYDLALAHHQHSLTIIHGVGEGVLRDEIHAILRLKREVKSFVNQYHSRYGYGATDIYFQY